MTTSHSCALVGNIFDESPDFMFFRLAKADDVKIFVPFCARYQHNKTL